MVSKKMDNVKKLGAGRGRENKETGEWGEENVRDKAKKRRMTELEKRKEENSWVAIFLH